MPKQKNLTQEEITRMTLQQGREVSAVLDMPGWAVIESAILMTKAQAETERKMKLGTDAAGSKALYFSGKVDGAEDVRVNVYEIVQAARRLIEEREREENSNEAA